MNNQESLDFAEGIAREAGKILMSYYGKELTRNIKTHENDFATEADLLSEKFILEQIQQNFPNDSIVAEESGKHTKAGAEYTWIIDPLDGTYNFANNKKNFGVLLARANKEGEIVLAVAYDPINQLMGKAVAGGGTWLNGKKVILSNERGEHVPISANREMKKTLGDIGESSTHFSAISAVLYSLKGEYWAHVGSSGYIWDFAVQALLLQEAGWIVTDLKGNTFKWDGTLVFGYPGVVAAPQEWHERVLDKVKS